jgi:hypothetical protein
VRGGKNAAIIKYKRNNKEEIQLKNARLGKAGEKVRKASTKKKVRLTDNQTDSKEHSPF